VKEARTRGFAAPAFAGCALSRDGRHELPVGTGNVNRRGARRETTFATVACAAD
jgi:hypothetical protein